jgi:acylphosphatase
MWKSIIDSSAPEQEIVLNYSITAILAPSGYKLLPVSSKFDKMNPMKKTMHCFVSGRVQGVCFRMETREQAQLFGITGWVRNLTDGRVEVMASGEETQLVHLQKWLKQGPDMARVLKVEFKGIEHKEFDGFTIR